MPDQDETVELNSIILVVRHWLWLFVLCFVFSIIAALIFTSVIPPSYEASVTLLIQPAQGTNVTEYNSLVAGERLALTYSQMLRGDLVLNQVISENNIHLTTSELAKRVSAEPIQNTQLIRLTVKDSSASQSAFLANAIAEVFTEQLQIIQNERYAGSLASIHENMDALLEQIKELESSIQKLNTKKIEYDVALAQMEDLLDEQQGNYRAFQDEIQSMELTIATLPEKISISERAHPSIVSPSNIAAVTVLINLSDLPLDANYSAETYGKMIVGKQILEAAIQQAALEMTASELSERISVVPITGTQLIELRVADANMSRALTLADAVADVFVKQIRDNQLNPYIENMSRLQNQIDTLAAQTKETQDNIGVITNQKFSIETEISNLEVQLSEVRTDYRLLQQDFNQTKLRISNAQDAVVITESATIPENSTRNRGMYILLGGVFGLLMAMGFVLLKEYMNSVIRGPEDIRRITNVNILGSIGQLKELDNEVIVLNQPRSPVAEALRVLATNIRIIGLNHPLRSIMITSPHAQEGKTFIIANLAVLLAQREINLIVVDADLRLPRLHHLYDLDQEPGLSDCILNKDTGAFLKQVNIENLRVLSSGALPSNPAEVLASTRMQKVISDLVEDSDLTLIDCTPILPVADASIIASYVDGVILVVRADHTHTKELRDALDNLRKVGGNLLGVVINGVPTRIDTYNFYYGDRLGKKAVGRKFKFQLNVIKAFLIKIGNILKRYVTRKG